MWRSSKHNISVVIPVYRSDGSLCELYDRLILTLEQIAEQFEIVMVEDGGEDGTWDVIQELAQKDRRVVGIQLSRNYGQHNALLCGIRQAKFEIIVTLDDDLQNPPEEIPCLIKKIDEGFDVVYGYPKKVRHSIWRTFASYLVKLTLQKSMGASTARNISSFRAMRSDIRRAFVNYRACSVSIDVLLTWGTSRFVAVPVRHEPRKIGKSNYSLIKLVIHALNMLVGFSGFPLKMASMLGFGLTLWGFGILAFVIGRWMVYGSAVPGFSFLASMIAIFSGSQLFALGIIGEYLSRIFFRTMEKPAYITRITTSGDHILDEQEK